MLTTIQDSRAVLRLSVLVRALSGTQRHPSARVREELFGLRRQAIAAVASLCTRERFAALTGQSQATVLSLYDHVLLHGQSYHQQWIVQFVLDTLKSSSKVIITI